VSEEKGYIEFKVFNWEFFVLFILVALLGTGGIIASLNLLESNVVYGSILLTISISFLVAVCILFEKEDGYTTKRIYITNIKLLNLKEVKNGRKKQ